MSRKPQVDTPNSGVIVSATVGKTTMNKFYVSYQVPVLTDETKFAGPYDIDEALSHAEDIANFEYVEECQIISEEKFIKQNSAK